VEDENLENQIEDNIEDLQPEPEGQRGYLTYEEWVNQGKDPDEFVGAKKYDAYGKLIKEVHDLKREVRSKNTTLETVMDLYKKEEERIAARYSGYYQQQQARLNEAEQQGDTFAVKDAVQNMARTEAQYNNELAQVKAQHTQRLVDEFRNRNSDWYNANNPHLVEKAQKLAIQYEREYPHLATSDPAYIFNKIEDEIRNGHLVANNYSGQKQAVPVGANYSLPASQSVVNKGGAPAHKSASLSPELREEFKQVQQFYANNGMEYTVNDFISFHERNKV
jgi:hypothetical protein